jgi:opacity protein-like surface antigen
VISLKNKHVFHKNVTKHNLSVGAGIYMKYFYFIVITLICTSFVMAQTSYDVSGDSIYFQSTSPQSTNIYQDSNLLTTSNELETVESSLGIEPIDIYTFGIRIGAGYALSLLDFGFKGRGVLQGQPAKFYEDDHDWGFHDKTWAGNFEIKFGLPKYLKNISVGLSLDYGCIPIEDMKFRAAGVIYYEGRQKKVTDAHSFALCAFLEYRVPFQVGTTWLAPYARFGAGMAFNHNDNQDLINIDEFSFAMYASIGAEYFLTKNISLFIEPRWKYNRPNVDFKPLDNQTCFEGNVYLNSLTFLVGINIYFGMGRHL